MALAFETVYGTAPASGYTRVPFSSTSLGSEQPLISSELLGYGREPTAPINDAVTAAGDVVVPIDAEAFGFWLKATFGAPTTTGTGPWTPRVPLRELPPRPGQAGAGGSGDGGADDVFDLANDRDGVARFGIGDDLDVERQRYPQPGAGPGGGSGSGGGASN